MAANIPHPAEASRSISANAEARIKHNGKNTIPMIDMVLTTDMCNSFLIRVFEDTVCSERRHLLSIGGCS